jgi:hypothetical protein
VENHVFLSRGVLVAGVAWWEAMRIVAGVEDLVSRIKDGRTGRVLSSRMIEKSGDAVCGLHCTRRRGARISWLSLKNKVDGYGFLQFDLKTGEDDFSRFGLKTDSLGLPVWDLKPAATV